VFLAPRKCTGISCERCQLLRSKIFYGTITIPELLNFVLFVFGDCQYQCSDSLRLYSYRPVLAFKNTGDAEPFPHRRETPFVLQQMNKQIILRWKYSHDDDSFLLTYIQFAICKPTNHYSRHNLLMDNKKNTKILSRKESNVRCTLQLPQATFKFQPTGLPSIN